MGRNRAAYQRCILAPNQSALCKSIIVFWNQLFYVYEASAELWKHRGIVFHFLIFSEDSCSSVLNKLQQSDWFFTITMIKPTENKSMNKTKVLLRCESFQSCYIFKELINNSFDVGIEISRTTQRFLTWFEVLNI